MKYEYDNFAFKIPFRVPVLKTACERQFICKLASLSGNCPDYAIRNFVPKKNVKQKEFFNFKTRIDTAARKYKFIFYHSVKSKMLGISPSWAFSHHKTNKTKIKNDLTSLKTILWNDCLLTLRIDGNKGVNRFRFLPKDEQKNIYNPKEKTLITMKSVLQKGTFCT